jgi:hypothetical protein
MDRVVSRFGCGLVWCALLTVCSSATAEAPRVQFDMPYAVACKELTPVEFADANPGQKLIEARFEISSLLAAGKERDLTQYFIRIEDPERKLAVVDYLPKTCHESRLASPVTISDTDEKNASLGINLAGKYEFVSSVGATAGIGQKRTSCVKYDLLPPLETVAASGTLLRGSGVYFKLKASPRHLLEGGREFALVLRVPAAWRSGCVHVRCEAEGIRRGLVSTFDEQVSCGRRDFVVALYLDGDETGRLAAEALARRRAGEVPSSKFKVQGPAKPEAWSLNAPWEMLRR